MQKKVVGIRRAGDGAIPAGTTTARAVLAHDDRHIRRKTIRLTTDEKVLVDLPEPTFLNTHDMLLLDDGGAVLVEAASEALYRVRGRDGVHLTQLAWHIGNRHLPAEIAADHILILRDHVIRAMLEGLGAEVTDITGPFTPTRGAYDGVGVGVGGGGSGHGHHHDHGHHHGHDHHHHD